MENKDNVELSGTSAYVAPEYLLDGKNCCFTFIIRLCGSILLFQLFHSLAVHCAFNLNKLTSPDVLDWYCPQ